VSPTSTADPLRHRHVNDVLGTGDGWIAAGIKPAAIIRPRPTHGDVAGGGGIRESRVQDGRGGTGGICHRHLQVRLECGQVGCATDGFVGCVLVLWDKISCKECALHTNMQVVGRLEKIPLFCFMLLQRHKQQGSCIVGVL
jgi:hypothetical protein